MTSPNRCSVRRYALVAVALLQASGCVSVDKAARPWVPPHLADHGEEVLPESGFLGWRSGSASYRTQLLVSEMSFPLTSPENVQLEVRCEQSIVYRTVEYGTHAWNVAGQDYACSLLGETGSAGHLQLRVRDDRRRVGRLELDGMAVQTAGLGILHAPGKQAPWTVLLPGAYAYLLVVDGRTVGHLSLYRETRLRLDPDLAPELRRDVALAATLLLAITVEERRARARHSVSVQ